MHRTPKATRTPNLDVVQTRKRKGKQVARESSLPIPSLKIRIRQHKSTSTTPLPPIKENVLEENMDKIVEGEDDLDGTEFADTKDDKKIDDDDDDHDDHTLIRIQVMGSSEITTKKMQTPIPSPPRSHKTDLSSDKENDQELMQMKKKYVTNNHLQDIKEKVNESLKDIAPKLATTTTIDLTNDDLPRIVANDVKKERESLQLVVPVLISQEFMKSDLQAQVVDPKFWDIFKSKFEKSSTSSCSCKNYAFRKRNHDEHQGDDAPRKGEKSAKRQKMSKSSKFARVIDKDEFWQTASTSTLEDGEVEITTTIDGQLKTIIEASLRRHLKLEDADGISSLPNSKFFKQLALMSPNKTAWEQFSSNIATAIIFLATNRTFNFSKMIFEGMVKNLDSRSKFLKYLRFIQILLNKHQRFLLPHKRTYIAPTLTQKLFSNMRRVSKGYTGVNIPLFSNILVQGPIQQGKGSTVSVESYHIPITTPSTTQPPLSSPSRVPTPPHDSPLPGDLKQTKKVYSNAYTKLIMRVKKLEHKVKSRQPKRRSRVVISDTKEDLEDPSKQGRRIAKIDQNPFISLVQDEGTSWIQEDARIQGRTSADTEILLDQEEPTKLVGDLGSGEKGEKEISTASVTPEVSTTAKNLVYIRRSAKKRKDKGKAIMKEDESVEKMTKKQLEQERLGHEEAIRLKEQINEEERQRIARDAEIAKQLQEEFNRARQEQEKKGGSFSKAKVRKNMCIYLKNRGGYKQSHFKGMKYEDIRPIFEKKSSKKRSREDSDEDNAKKHKLEDDAEKKELRDSMDVVLKDDIAIDDESLATKYSIVDWKTHILFEPNEDDEIWKNQQDYNLISWRLFDSCGIHMLLMHTGIAIHMMIEKKYPLTQEMLSRMLSRRLEVDQESEMAFELLREDTFADNEKDDAYGHVERILDIVSLFNIPGVIHDVVMLCVFPITLWSCKKNQLPPKEEDLGSFILSCSIGRLDFNNALADLGASINIMPFSMYKHLGMGKLEPISMVIKMADNTKSIPKGIVKNLLIKIDKFIFPVDFILLDIIEDFIMPIILGRPLPATTHAKVDIFRKSISLEESYKEEDTNKEKFEEYETVEQCLNPAEKRAHWCKALSQEKGGLRKYWASCDTHNDICDGGGLPNNVERLYWESTNDNE
ncbi:ribonuclease H-like domain-containing protein [Tanacetum coccineum]